METNNIINTQSAYELVVENAFTISQVNEILRNDINSGDTQYTQLKWNKFEKKFVTRKFFTAYYLKNFKAVSDYITHRLWLWCHNSVPVTKFFIEPVNEDYTTTLLKCSDKFSNNEYYAFLEKLRWGVTIYFPKKNFHYPRYLVDINYYFVYSYFENDEGEYDHAFMEYSSVEDTFNGEYYEPFFHRGYVSLKGQTFPFFKEPICECVSKSRDYRDTIDFNVINYLNKNLGMFATVSHGYVCYYKEEPLSNKSEEYYKEDYYTQLKKEDYFLTLAETKQLDPIWKDQDDGDY